MSEQEDTWVEVAARAYARYFDFHNETLHADHPSRKLIRFMVKSLRENIRTKITQREWDDFVADVAEAARTGNDSKLEEFWLPHLDLEIES